MNKPSVMLIEDNDDDLELTIWVLKKIGLEFISIARDGQEAITMLHGDEESGGAASCRPDIIILDLRLPKVDGIDVLRRIRSDERTKDIRVFALTSSEDPHDRELCNELGVPAFFSKPLNENAVLNLNLF